MDAVTKIAIFEDKIQEYFLSCQPSGLRQLQDKSFLQEWPLYKFNIQLIYRSVRDNKLVPEELIEKCGDKLIDIKLVFCYLLTSFQLFYRGTTLIVGNDEIEKLNPNTLSLLRADHYKVYLVTVIIENILDLLELVFNKREANYRKNKWEKILGDTLKRQVIGAVNEHNVAILLAFKEKYRTAELHKYSAVRAFTSKDKWNHFQVEEKIVNDIISDMSIFFLSAWTTGEGSDGVSA